MLRINRTRVTTLAAVAAIATAFAAPSAAFAAGSSWMSAGKVSYSDLSATAAHPGGANFLMADGSVRFIAYDPAFRGGIYVAAGDTGAPTGRITAVVVDPSDPTGAAEQSAVGALVVDPSNPSW